MVEGYDRHLNVGSRAGWLIREVFDNSRTDKCIRFLDLKAPLQEPLPALMRLKTAMVSINLFAASDVRSARDIFMETVSSLIISVSFPKP